MLPFTCVSKCNYWCGEIRVFLRFGKVCNKQTYIMHTRSIISQLVGFILQLKNYTSAEANEILIRKLIQHNARDKIQICPIYLIRRGGEGFHNGN